MFLILIIIYMFSELFGKLEEIGYISIEDFDLVIFGFQFIASPTMLNSHSVTTTIFKKLSPVSQVDN